MNVHTCSKKKKKKEKEVRIIYYSNFESNTQSCNFQAVLLKPKFWIFPSKFSQYRVPQKNWQKFWSFNFKIRVQPPSNFNQIWFFIFCPNSRYQLWHKTSPQRYKTTVYIDLDTSQKKYVEEISLQVMAPPTAGSNQWKIGPSDKNCNWFIFVDELNCKISKSRSILECTFIKRSG